MSVENTTRSDAWYAQLVRAITRALWGLLGAILRALGRKARHHPYVAIWVASGLMLALRLGL